MSELDQHWQKDSDLIFKQITASDFKTVDEVRRAIVMLYVPDMTISRAGISHAMKRLEKHFGFSEPI